MIIIREYYYLAVFIILCGCSSVLSAGSHSRHRLRPGMILATLALLALLGSQPCHATLEEGGDHHQQDLGPVHQHKEGADHGEKHLKGVVGDGSEHRGGADGHSEAGHHGEVSR